MTPFMIAVQDLVEGGDHTEPATASSHERRLAEATDEQMMIRSLAEQLVSEANAILREHGPVVDLTDECGPGALAFTLSYCDRSARLQTSMSGRSAIARLTTSADRDTDPRTLAGEDELQAVVLSLIAPRP